MNPEDIRDVKVPLQYPDVAFWVFVVCVVILLGALIGGFLYGYRKRHPKKEVPVILPKPWDVAIEALNALIAKDYLNEGQFHFFYSELSDILRRYIEDRFSIRAPEMTTEEFLISLKHSDKLKNEQKDVLRGFLKSADMVKFAQYEPSVDEAKEGYARALDFVQETALKEEHDI